MNRISLLEEMDRLLNDCKKCDKSKLIYINPERDCGGCEIYRQLRSIGNQLEGNAEMTITLERYIDLKEEGMSDAEIAKEVGVKQPTLSYHKKKWKETTTEKSIQADTLTERTTETKTTQSENETKLQSLVNDLSDEVNNKNETIKQLKEKVADLEHVNAACDDVESETTALQGLLEFERQAKEQVMQNYNQVSNELIKTDAELENHKHWLKTAGEELNRLQKENKHLWALISLKATELNG